MQSEERHIVRRHVRRDRALAHLAMGDTVILRAAPLAIIDGHSLRMYTVILLWLQSFFLSLPKGDSVTPG